VSTAPRLSPPFGERRQLALLSALAEAPDFSAAATFLLGDLLALAGARRACLFRFDIIDEQLVLEGSLGFEDSFPSELAIGERTHPWMVSTLALSPVTSATPARTSARIPFERWTALPMPRPHYRGAPAIWPDSYAEQVLAPLGAKLVPLEDRQFSSAPGGVVVVDALVDETGLQEIASLLMCTRRAPQAVAASATLRLPSTIVPRSPLR